MDARAWEVRKAYTRLAIMLDEYQEEKGLTDNEMLQALALWQSSVLKYCIQAEREADDAEGVRQ